MLIFAGRHANVLFHAVAKIALGRKTAKLCNLLYAVVSTAQQGFCNIKAGKRKVAAGCCAGALQKQLVKIGGAKPAGFGQLLHGKGASVILLDQLDCTLAGVVCKACGSAAASFV